MELKSFGGSAVVRQLRCGPQNSSLKRRIETILANRTGTDLNRMKKILLASARIAAVVALLLIGLGDVPAIRAQSRTGSVSRPEFEVASVKLLDHPVPVHPYRLDINHGTLKIDAVPLRFIIGLAYAGQGLRVEGGPSWINGERYDIQAKSGNPNASTDEIRVMLQNLLADRFRLAFHNETRQVPIYTLLVAKGGPKLKPAKDNEQAGITRSGDRDLVVTFQKWPMTGLVSTLSGIVGSPVRDQTGLTGTYDFKLEWSPDPSVESGLSIFTAVQEQLGLKLEADKGPVEIMVIDHVDHATPN